MANDYGLANLHLQLVLEELSQDQREMILSIGRNSHSPEEVDNAFDKMPELEEAYLTAYEKIEDQINFLREPIDQFCSAGTEEEACQILVKYPELLGDLSTRILDEMISFAEKKGLENAQMVYKFYRDYLQDCRTVGGPPTFSEQICIGVKNSRRLVTLVPVEFTNDITKVFDFKAQAIGQPSLWARVIEILEILIKRVPSNQDQYQAALSYELGVAYKSLITGDLSENLKQAIKYFEAALAFFAYQKSPFDFAAIQNDLGITYYSLQTGDRNQNLFKAIDCFEKTLIVYLPEDSPVEYANVLNNLGLAYVGLLTGNKDANIYKAIEYYGEALRVCTPEIDPSVYAKTQNNLGSAYYGIITGDKDANIQTAIKCYEESLRFRTLENAPREYAGVQNNLGIAYTDLSAGDKNANLHKAILHFQESLRFRTPQLDPLSYALTINNMGKAYSNLEEGNINENLHKAINYYEISLKYLTPDATPFDYALVQHNLGIANKGLCSEDRTFYLHRAIDCFNEALRFRTSTDAPLLYANTQNDLGKAYYELTDGDRAKNLQLALGCFREALRFRTVNNQPSEYASTQMNIGNGYFAMPSGNIAENYQHAKSCYQEALNYTSKEIAPLDYAIIQNNLGNIYRSLTTGDRFVNLNKAIAYFKEALTIYSPENSPLNYASVQNNLGATYLSFESNDENVYISQAIDCFNESLRYRTPEAVPYDYASTKMNLGNAFYKMPTQNRTENLRIAIASFEEALRFLTPSTDPYKYSAALNNLGAVYSELDDENRTENLERAITYLLEALRYRKSEFEPMDYADTQNNLGDAYRALYDGNNKQYLDQAIACYNEALRFRLPEVSPHNCYNTAHTLGKLLMSLHKWPEAAQAFHKAIVADQILFESAIFQSSKETALVASRDIYSDACYVYCKLGNKDKAIETLEAGRTRQMREVLETSQRKIEKLEEGCPDLYRDYINATNEFNSGVRQIENEFLVGENEEPDIRKVNSERLEHLHQQVQKAIESIRRLDGYEDFFRPLSVDKIALLASEVCPLVYITFTEHCGLALLVNGERIELIWLNSLTSKELQEQLIGSSPTEFVSGYLSSYVNWKEHPNDAIAQYSWYENLTQTTHWLWEACLSPIIEKVNEFGSERLILIPSGFLSLLPLHAAWTEDALYPTGRRYSMDTICFSYASSAHALISLKDKTTRPTETLLAIDNPDGSLLFSDTEVQLAIKHFKANNHLVLKGHQANLYTVKQEMTKVNVMHFSTHGVAELIEPLHSRLVLSNFEALTLEEVLKFHLSSARLVVLSACETSIPGIKLLDEVVSLPSGFIQAGVPGVVGSLWLVNDSATMLLMARFYDNWLDQRMQPAEALRQAQIWLRDSTNDQKAKYFRAALDVQGAGKFHNQVNQIVNQRLLLEDPENHSFAHPFFWAAFGYTGL